VRVQLRVKLSIVAKENTNGLISINATDLKIRAKCMLNEVPMVSRNLEPIGASDFHQGLVSSLSGDSMRNFIPQLQEISRSMEVRVEEGLASSETRDMSCK
jgi:hypothetical protein